MNGWKVLAIILLVLLVAENILIYNMVQWGIRDIDKEAECSINICEPYESYTYEDSICTCYNGLEAQHTEFVS